MSTHWQGWQCHPVIFLSKRYDSEAGFLLLLFEFNTIIRCVKVMMIFTQAIQTVHMLLSGDAKIGVKEKASERPRGWGYVMRMGPSRGD